MAVFYVGVFYVGKKERKRKREELDIGAGYILGERFLYPLCQTVCVLYAV